MGIFFANSFTKKKNIFRILLLYKTSIELVKKPACKTNLDENEIVLHSILLFFHLKAVEQKKQWKNQMHGSSIMLTQIHLAKIGKQCVYFREDAHCFPQIKGF